MKKSLIAASVALLPTFAQAQTPPIGHIPFFVCDSTQSLFERLLEQYGESREFCGTSSPIHLDCHWRNADSGSWTHTRTNIQADVSCILLSGQNSNPVDKPEPSSY